MSPGPRAKCGECGFIDGHSAFCSQHPIDTSEPDPARSPLAGLLEAFSGLFKPLPPRPPVDVSMRECAECGSDRFNVYGHGILMVCADCDTELEPDALRH